MKKKILCTLCMVLMVTTLLLLPFNAWADSTNLGTKDIGVINISQVASLLANPNPGSSPMYSADILDASGKRIDISSIKLGGSYTIRRCWSGANSGTFEYIKFRIDTKLNPPTITQPSVNNISFKYGSVSIAWTTVPYAASYKLRLLDLTESGIKVQDDISLTVATYTIPEDKLIPGHNYLVQITSCAEGSTDNWTGINFSINNPGTLPAPKINYPLNGGELNYGDLKAEWEAVAGAQYYGIYLFDKTENKDVIASDRGPEKVYSTRYMIPSAVLKLDHTYELSIYACSDEKLRGVSKISFTITILATPTSTPIPAQTPTPASTCNPKTFDIKGYVAPDFVCSSKLKANFTVEVVGTNLKTQSDECGYFAIRDIPANMSCYTIKFSKPQYLERTISNIPGTGNTVSVGSAVEPVEMWTGDINKDDILSMPDIMEITKCLNSASGDQRYAYACDLNKDDVVNLADVLIVCRHFNNSSSDYPEPVITIKT